MTIQISKETKSMIAQCDECLDVVEFEDLNGLDRDDWADAKSRIDADGWKTRRGPDGKWINVCCDCVSK